MKRSVAGEDLLPTIDTLYKNTPKRPKFKIRVIEDDDYVDDDDVVEE